MVEFEASCFMPGSMGLIMAAVVLECPVSCQVAGGGSNMLLVPGSGVSVVIVKLIKIIQITILDGYSDPMPYKT